VPRFEIVARSRLGAPAAVVWERVSTIAGVNDELAPLFRMTHPEGLDRLEPGLAELGRPAFRSRVLLFGLVPGDYDDLTIVRLDPGRGFLERSPMGSQRYWEHERRIEPAAGGCVVVDRVCHEPRVPFAERAQSAFLRQLFLHRHRRLRRRFGGGAARPRPEFPPGVDPIVRFRGSF
jgi:ligand-binding SRPBCC domain-containing protein